MERGWRRCSRVWVTFLGMPEGRAVPGGHLPGDGQRDSSWKAGGATGGSEPEQTCGWSAERASLCSGTGSGARGVQVRSTGWARTRGRDSGDRTAGTGSRAWTPASTVLPGHGADRHEAPPRGESHRCYLGAGSSLLWGSGWPPCCVPEDGDILPPSPS